jgi:predicted HicB family RNase H-like nuclease
MTYKTIGIKSENIIHNKALEEIAKEEEIVFTTRIPKVLHKDLKTKALQEDVPIVKVIAALVNKYVNGEISIN